MRADLCVKNNMDKEEKRRQMLSLAEQWQQIDMSQGCFCQGQQH